MKIKGTSVSNTNDYVKSFYPLRYKEWVESLPEKSREIFSNPILASNWYNITDSQVEPIKKIADLFYESKYQETFYKVGKDGADRALKGIYKIFIKIATLEFVIKRASVISSTYYTEDGGIKIIENNKDLLLLDIIGFEPGQEMMIENISGWLDGLLEIVTNKNYHIQTIYKGINNNKLDSKIKVTF